MRASFVFLRPAVPGVAANLLFDTTRERVLKDLLNNQNDKSLAGRVDPQVFDLVTLVNECPDYVTSSSCSGRVSIFHKGKAPAATGLSILGEADGARRKRGSFGKGTIFQSHDPLPLSIETTIVPALTEFYNWRRKQKLSDMSARDRVMLSRSEVLQFKFEPMILHVICKDIDAAAALLQCASESGQMHSGIASCSRGTSDHRKIVCCITSPLVIDVPLFTNGTWLMEPSNMGSDGWRALLTKLVEYGNLLFEENRQRRERFMREVRTRIADRPATGKEKKPKAATAMIADAKGVLVLPSTSTAPAAVKADTAADAKDATVGISQSHATKNSSKGKSDAGAEEKKPPTKLTKAQAEEAQIKAILAMFPKNKQIEKVKKLTRAQLEKQHIAAIIASFPKSMLLKKKLKVKRSLAMKNKKHSNKKKVAAQMPMVLKDKRLSMKSKKLLAQMPMVLKDKRLSMKSKKLPAQKLAVESRQEKVLRKDLKKDKPTVQKKNDDVSVSQQLAKKGAMARKKAATKMSLIARGIKAKDVKALITGVATRKTRKTPTKDSKSSTKAKRVDKHSRPHTKPKLHGASKLFSERPSTESLSAKKPEVISRADKLLMELGKMLQEYNHNLMKK